MFYKLHLSCSISSVLSTNMDDGPCFDKQPTLFISTFKPNSSLDDAVSDCLSLKGILGADKIISLEFSIDHTFGVKNKAIYESDLFRLQKMKISLKKYKKKSFTSEEYLESSHKPVLISLPPIGYRKNGYFLSVSPCLRRSRLVALKENCQHILIYCQVERNEKVLLKDLKKAVEDFKKFMELSKSEKPLDYGYRFFVELNDAYPPNTWPSSKVISSRIFQFIFNTTSPLIDLIKEKEENFHLGE